MASGASRWRTTTPTQRRSTGACPAPAPSASASASDAITAIVANSVMWSGTGSPPASSLACPIQVWMGEFGAAVRGQWRPPQLPTGLAPPTRAIVDPRSRAVFARTGGRLLFCACTRSDSARVRGRIACASHRTSRRMGAGYEPQVKGRISPLSLWLLGCGPGG